MQINPSRKYRITILYLVLSTAAVFSGHKDLAAWLQYTSLVVMAFMGGNAVEHLANKDKKDAQ